MAKTPTRRAGEGGRASRTPRKSWTKQRRERFLVELAASCNVSAAARAAEMHTTSAYNLRSRDPEFRAAWSEALAQGYERLELAMLERAIHGVEKDVWYRGEQVGKVNAHSDALGLGLLRIHRTGAKGIDAPPGRDEAGARERVRARIDAMRQRLRGNG